MIPFLERSRYRGARDALAQFTLSKTAELAPPGKLPVSKPPSPQKHESVDQAASSLIKAMPPFKAPSFKPQALATSPTLAPPKLELSPPQLASAQVAGNAAQMNFQSAAKLSEWSLRPRPRLPPGRIHPDNGVRQPGTNFESPRRGILPSISQQFDSIDPTRNSDPMDPR